MVIVHWSNGVYGLINENEFFVANKGSNLDNVKSNFTDYREFDCTHLTEEEFRRMFKQISNGRGCVDDEQVLIDACLAWGGVEHENNPA